MSRNMRRGGNMSQQTKCIHEFHELSGISITGIIKMEIKCILAQTAVKSRSCQFIAWRFMLKGLVLNCLFVGQFRGESYVLWFVCFSSEFKRYE